MTKYLKRKPHNPQLMALHEVKFELFPTKHSHYNLQVSQHPLLVCSSSLEGSGLLEQTVIVVIHFET